MPGHSTDGIDPIFEKVQIGASTYETNVWFQSAEGNVYFNRDLTPFKFLPFIMLDFSNLPFAEFTCQDTAQ